MSARTPHTLTNLEAIMTELVRVRTQGYATVDQEVELGLRSIAVPISNARGLVIAALNSGLSASTEPIEAVVQNYLQPLLEVGQELAGILS
jgi:IclR family pca regulon transcriptional regulator